MAQIVAVLGVWIALFVGMEAGAWYGLKGWFGHHPSDNPLVNEYFKRAHPLFADNEDLRAEEIGYAFHPMLGYVLRPNVRYAYDHRGRKAYLESDATGRIHNGDPERNPRLSTAPKATLYRVVLFGGSTMIGQNASSNAQTIPAQLERQLEARWPGVTFQVINAGVFGYVSTQERLSYELEFRAARPDLVIFLDGFNDAMASAPFEQWHPHTSSMTMSDAAYVRQFSPSSAFQAWATNMLRFPEPLATLALLRRAMSRMGGGAATEPTGATAAQHYHPEAARQLEETIDALGAEVAAADGRALFVLQPNLGQAKPLTLEEQATADAIRASGRQFDVLAAAWADYRPIWAKASAEHRDGRSTFLDLTDAFKGVNAHIYDDIVHYNDTGNQILAGRMLGAVQTGIESDLRKKGLLP